MSGEGNNRDNRRFNWFVKCFPCFNPGQEQDDLMSISGDEEGDAAANGTNLAVRSNDRAKLWTYCDIVRHGSMLYSWATSKAEPGPYSFCRISVVRLQSGEIYVGLFDGHGSSDLCAIYADGKMFKNLQNISRSNTRLEDDLIEAFLRTDEQWLEKEVSKRYENDRLIAAAGTSGLVAVIGGDQIYIASAGDSRAVMGKISIFNHIIPHALNIEDFVNDAFATDREELRIEHPEPDFITEDSHCVYSSIKGVRVSKSIGDAFLKSDQFHLNDHPQYRLHSPITISALSPIPSTEWTEVQPSDQFIILGSKGFWELITNREAVLIVQVRKRKKRGIAALLIRCALNKVAKRHQMTYRKLQKAISQGNGNNKYYNDIGVVIVFFKETSQGTITEEEAQQDADTRSTSTSTEYSTGLEDEGEEPDYFSGLEEFEVDYYDAVASSSGGEGDAVASSSGGGIALSMGEGGGGGGGDVVVGSNRGVGNVVGEGGESSSSIAEEGPMFWTTKDERHCFGNVSTAVIQANKALEDISQVEMGCTAVFVGIYDGHGGNQAALFVSRTLTRILMERIRDTTTMSADHLRDAFIRTDALWLEKVDAKFEKDQYMASYGTCCLVGVFWRRTLFLANAGDSRAVIARAKEDNTAKFVAEPLTRDDNVKHLEVRKEVLALHPDEPGFVVEDSRGAFRIKGRIQVSKSIGDAYLKRARFNINHLEKKELNSPVIDDNHVLSADPSIYTIPIGPQDRFVIFASDGLWDMLSNEDAVRIVQESPKEGIAERLVTAALTKAAADISWTLEDLLRLRRDNGQRRKTHDDISVVVIFFDHTIDQMAAGEIKEVFKKISIRQGSVTEGESNFTALDELVAEEEEEEEEEEGDVVPSLSGGGGDVAGLSGGEGDVAS